MAHKYFLRNGGMLEVCILEDLSSGLFLTTMLLCTAITYTIHLDNPTRFKVLFSNVAYWLITRPVVFILSTREEGSSPITRHFEKLPVRDAS